MVMHPISRFPEAELSSLPNDEFYLMGRAPKAGR
jgi:hypothetical protein